MKFEETTETLPIFPLPLVLLPGEALPLHIFEDRYREMLSYVQATTKRFGINFVDEGTDERPPSGAVGCVAELRDVQTLPDGRSNILTVGRERYRIDEYIDGGDSFLTARVNLFSDEQSDIAASDEAAERVLQLFQRIAKAALDISGRTGPLPEIERAEPETFSFAVAAAFGFENELKLSLLRSTDTLARLNRLEKFLSEHVGQAEDNASLVNAAHTNGHSKKPIDY